VREVEEESCYRPRSIEHLVTFEPMIGMVCSAHHVFLARGVERIADATELNEDTEAVLPDQVLRLPEELARVDALLDDPVFFAPFVPFFDPRVGRPSTPMEVYLRMMFLKFRYRLG